MSVLDAFREHRPFPGQDPWVVAHDGSLLLVQSAGGNRRIVVKRFSDLARMDRNVQTVVWAAHGHGAHSHHVWAPELHHLDGRWYLYYSASERWARSHRTFALVADDPLGPFRPLGRVCDPANDVWAIDLTVLGHEGQLYAFWSGWEGPDDGFPQNLYVAPMSNPWTISGERRCIARPEHDWEKSVAPVNEGPQVLRDPGAGRLFVLYSADASWTQAYKMGLLELTGPDVGDPASWRKRPEPFFTDGGHGCVVETSAGASLVYHRKLGPDPGWADREIRWAPLAWDGGGYPVVGRTGDEAVGPRRRSAPGGGVTAPFGSAAVGPATGLPTGA